MTPHPADLCEWSATRWWTIILLVFAVHVGLVLTLENRAPITVRKAHPATLQLHAAGSPAFWAIEDPALFALPRREGFSGPAWLEVPRLEFQPQTWSEPRRYLPLNVPNLTRTFQRFIRTNPAPDFDNIVAAEPRLVQPSLFSLPPEFPASSVAVRGGLEGRKLLSRWNLESWKAPELLTNTIIQVLVNRQGQTISAAILPPGSGHRPADLRALELARTARFQPVDSTGRATPALDIGQIVFTWKTEPPAATNTALETP
jgi:hypothetical protein